MAFGRILLIAPVVAGLSLASGCASVSVNRVTSRDQPGIRYWRPAPYIALEPKTEGGAITCEAKLVMLPDKTEEYAITMNAGLGTASMEPTLADGWNLTGMKGAADSKTAENITAIASLIKALPVDAVAKAGTPKPKRTRSTIPNCSGLIKIVYDPVTGELVRFKKMDLPITFTTTEKTTPAPKPPPGGGGGVTQ